MQREEYDSQFKEYLWLLWARKASILMVAAIVAGAALLYASREPRTYSSSAEVFVRPDNPDPFETSGIGEYIVLDAQQRVANSIDVARLAAERLGGRLAAGISVEAPDRSQTLVFKSVSPSPAAAQRTAQAFAEAYLEFRRTDLTANVRALSGALDERIEELGSQIAEVQRSMVEAGDEIQRSALDARRNSLAKQRENLEQRRNELVMPEDVQLGRILRPASSAVAAGTGRGRTLSFALFIGTALGMAQAILRARFDQRLRGRLDLSVGAQAPVLALIPEAPASRNGRQLTVMSSGSPDAEAYRALRETFLFAVKRHSIRSLIVTGPNPREGKTSTTANLGVALALGGKRVILVSADLHRPQLQAYFPANADVGLTSVLNGERTALEALSPTFLSQLHVLHAGPLAGGSRDLLSSEGMRRTITDLEREADIVLIDTPPVLTAADTLAIAPLVPAVLLVAAADRTTVAALEEARLRLEQVGAVVIGAVLNNVGIGRARFDQHDVRQNGMSEVPGAIAPGRNGWSA